ncbi:MAG: response regulator [Candidatus Acidiferrales bacterium]
MKRALFRCHTCGSRNEVLLNESDERQLRSNNYLTRFCRECRGNTRWDLYESLSSVHLADAEPEEELRGHILLIDDDEDILLVIGKALSKEQFDLETANSARKAVQLLARGDYDVVLSDIRMPDFDGKQLFEFLDQHLPELKQRVIFLTGDTGNPNTLEFLQKSGRPFLSKPVDLPALLELVRQYLPRRQDSSKESS